MKIKPRAYLTKTNNVDPTRIKIAFYLYKLDKPATLSEISKASQISPQLLNHHLPKLIQEGIALQTEEAGKKYYLLQPFYYDTGIMEAIYSTLTPIVTFIHTNESDYTQTNLPPEEAIINCIHTLIRFIDIEIQDIKT